jgi:uncharacterized cofD-like protein
MQEVNNKIKVVTIGGGTGSFTLLTELKELEDIELSAIVAMSDSGGSTGKLRVDMGVLPAGDVRQVLVALSRSPEMLRKLFTYRYDVGTMTGHTFGNLFLSTLEKITGSLEESIRQAGKILNIKGRVYPVTLTKHHLSVTMSNGEVIHGEGMIDERFVQGYTSIELTDKPMLNPMARKAILDADVVIVAPGNFYCSILPNFLVPGLNEVLHDSTAEVVLVANLLTKQGHTTGFSVAEFLNELRRNTDGFLPTKVLYNTNMDVTQELLELIESEQASMVELGDVSEFEDKYNIEFVGADLVANSPSAPQSNTDTVKRSLLRHDAKRVLSILGLEKSGK